MRLVLLYTLIIILFSCKTSDSGPQEVDVADAKVVILNEGNFNFGNASVSIYNEMSREVENKVFQNNNNGRPIGDVLQSALQFGNELFMVINNSSKIEVLNATNFKAIQSIQNINSPRYIQKIDENKAYVSDLYEDKLYVLNPRTKLIQKTIETKGWIEGMAIFNNLVFACHVDSNQVWVIDSNSDSIIAKINTHIQPQSIELDMNNKLWLSCSGGFNGDKSALYKINSSTLAVEQIFEAEMDKTIGELELNSTKEVLYYLGTDGLFEMDVTDSSLPTNPLIENENRLYYGFSVSPVDEIYISDAIDYQQRGVIYRYTKAGLKIDAFKVGIIPGDILFLD